MIPCTFYPFSPWKRSDDERVSESNKLRKLNNLTADYKYVYNRSLEKHRIDLFHKKNKYTTAG